MSKTPKVDLPVSDVVPIVGDAALAGPVADGRLVPVVIVDTSARPEVEELFRVHALLKAGDVSFVWATSREDDDIVLLLIDFVRPMEVRIALRISIERQGILVESMLTSQALYLQEGVVGDRLLNTMEAQRILVELPLVGFEEDWDRIVLDRMTSVFSGEAGIPRREARPKAEKFLAEVRRLTRLRFDPLA